jgi:hypothetical protein
MEPGRFIHGQKQKDDRQSTRRQTEHASRERSDRRHSSWQLAIIVSRIEQSSKAEDEYHVGMFPSTPKSNNLSCSSPLESIDDPRPAKNPSV